MPLDATPGSALANSFTTRAFADAFFADQMYADDWTGADSADKDKALVTATRLIVDAVGDGWLGWPTNTGQGLPFPRAGLSNRLGVVALAKEFVPVELQQATAEYARQLLALGRMPDTPSDTVGISALSAGPVSLTFDTSYQQQTTDLPGSVWAKISWLIGRSSMSLPVVRS